MKNIYIVALIVFTMSLVGCKNSSMGIKEEATETTEITTNSALSNKIGNLFENDNIKKNTKEVEKGKNTINKALDDTKKIKDDIESNIKNDWNKVKEKVK